MPRIQFAASTLLAGALLFGGTAPCHLHAVESESASPASEDSVAAGHSYHGEAFNEGPRQAAVLMEGMAPIDFPTSTQSESAQKFIEQGIAQLHGFWYLEAERSFRQAAKEDPELAIAYWGMAMANANNEKRARSFVDQAKKKSQKNTTRREKLYIEALDHLISKADTQAGGEKELTAKAKADQREKDREAKRRRVERYMADLEKILHEFPDDVEAKAFLVVQMWMGERSGVKLTSRYAVNALLSEIFDANPEHPSHHYRIHLWDSARPANALKSAAGCGPASPGIAHMWHMPGHIYSKLKRYGDAAWQQEASARVDHAHMIQTRLMPDQIHNFAHNNEWLVRNLVYVGRVDDAIDLARNLVSLPRHPSYNSLEKRGSHKYGRQRVVQVLTQYGLWDQLIEDFNGQYLPPTEHVATARDESGWLGVAQFMAGKRGEGGQTLRRLQRELLALQGRRLDALDNQNKPKENEQSDDAAKDAANQGDKQKKDEKKNDAASDDQIANENSGEKKRSDDPKELKRQMDSLRKVIARVAAAAAAKRKDKEALKRFLPKAKLDNIMQAEWYAMAGEMKTATELAKKAVKDGPSQVRPLAVLVHLLWKDGKKEEAQKQFTELRTLAGHADLKTPLLARLAPVASAAKAKGDWRTPAKPAKDLGSRPPLDELGPFRWQPYQAGSWTALSPEGDIVTDAELGDRPKLLIFYLGFGCLHCVDQLHAFAPLHQKFLDQGIDVYGISTESSEDLITGIKAFDEELNIPLFSDEDKKTFHRFRCWDDFEQQPLHGTFLIDGKGQVRWQDISYEPFMDADFLLKESKRLLDLP